ncbi:alpha-2-macroglobulin family protein [Anaerolineales bacterium HSG6]|nr:alpha-2-macroglobulin family protein [Anaerolineales bacterium HSG6]
MHRMLSSFNLAAVMIMAVSIVSLTLWSAPPLSATPRQQQNQLSLGDGIPIQLIDPSGLNQVQFWATASTTPIDFTLYSLTPAEFATRYGDLRSNWNQPITSTDLTELTRWQQVSKLDSGDVYGSLRQATMLPTVPHGLYLLTASHADLGQDSMYLAVTSQVLTLKRGGTDSLLAWSINLQSSQPTSNMTVSLYDEHGQSVKQASTDADGLAKFELDSTTPVLAIGTTADSVTLAGLDSGWRTDYGYWYWDDWGYYGSSSPYHSYLYTDRPIYRPGDTINFAAILRQQGQSDTGLSYSPLASTQPVSVTLRDSRYNVVTSQVFQPNSFGTIDGSFTLADEPPMGNYQLLLEFADFRQTQQLKVEAYRKPEYQVQVSTPLEYGIAGDEIPITVQADYFFGQPVSHAELSLKIYRQTYYWGGYRQLVTELTGTTDGQGQFETLFATDGSLGQDTTYTFEATVTEASNQPITGQKNLPVYWNDASLTLTTERYGYKVGDTVIGQISMHDRADQPVTNRQVTVEVYQGYPYNSPLSQKQVTTDQQGQAQVDLSGLSAGWYRLTISALDGRGRKMNSYRYLWLYGGTGWYPSSNDELKITVDQDSYQVGDTAQLLIESQLTGKALLTLERDGLYEEMVIDLSGPVTLVDVPIKEAFAPNVFAKLHIFKPHDSQSTDYDYGSEATPEGKLLTTEARLLVSPEHRRLSVKILPSAEEYQPGDQAELTLQVTDQTGQAVSAQFSLALVDEAIFALSDDLSADLFDTFYAPQSNRVTAYDSLSPRRYYWGRVTEDADGGTFAPTGTATPSPTQPPNAGDDTNKTTEDPRRVFQDTAYWNANIQTNAQGQAKVTVNLPDNLTTWRILAKAVTVDTKVGEGTAEILVSKDMIMRPALPRFAVLGDTFALNTVVQNYTGHAVDGQVSVSAPDLTLLDGATRQISLTGDSTGNTARSSWTAVASQVGDAQVTCAVDTSLGGDAVELTLPIKPYAVPDRWQAAGQVDTPLSARRAITPLDGYYATETFTMPFNAVHDTSELTIRLSPSVALGVLDGLDSLINYPYGCVEQTMSRVLPSAVAAKTYQDLGIPNPKADELPDIIDQGLTKLYGYQQSNGGWGWWYDDEGNTYLTAYVLLGLTMVEQAGFEVNPAVLNSGFNALDQQLDSQSDARILAYALYVKALAGRGDLSMAQSLLARQNELDSFGQAALALALHADGDSASAQALLESLLSQAEKTPTGVYWPTSDHKTEYHWRTMASREKNTGMALLALTKLRPQHDLLPKTARWLMEHRRGAGWRDTQATAFAVLSLSSYLQISGELQADYRYFVFLNDGLVGQGQINGDNLTTAIEPLVIGGADLHDGQNVIRLERYGEGQLYYSAGLHQELFYDSFTAVSSQDAGLGIERRYSPVDGSSPQDETLREDEMNYKIGDIVEVELQVSAKDEAWYVLVEDPLPAGFEAINERLNNTAYSDNNGPSYWHYWGYNRKNIYDDKVSFFVTRLWPGDHTYTYLMRATTAGRFSVPPAQIYPMYDEEVWGRSTSQQVTIAPDDLQTRPNLQGDFDDDCRLTEFDLRQVAGAWGSRQTNRDLDQNGVVDLRDVSTVAVGHGSDCLTTPQTPVQGDGQANFALFTPVNDVAVGETFEVLVQFDQLSGIGSANIQPASATGSAGILPASARSTEQQLGGFSLNLTFNPNRYQIAALTQSDTLSATMPLGTGPQLDNSGGTVALGMLNLPDLLGQQSQLVTITFTSLVSGPVEFTRTSLQAVNASGQLIESQVEITNIELRRQSVYLPSVRR